MCVCVCAGVCVCVYGSRLRLIQNSPCMGQERRRAAWKLPCKIDAPPQCNLTPRCVSCLHCFKWGAKNYDAYYSRKEAPNFWKPSPAIPLFLVETHASCCTMHRKLAQMWQNSASIRDCLLRGCELRHWLWVLGWLQGPLSDIASRTSRTAPGKQCRRSSSLALWGSMAL